MPKTIDNDINYCEHSFGLLTAIEQAKRVLYYAHVEAKGAPNGIGLVKVMGAAPVSSPPVADSASQNVNFTLVPEVPFALHGERGLLASLRQRMLQRQHAVIVVAEGAGQDLFPRHLVEKDASGNVKNLDIGEFLRDQIRAYFAQHGPAVDLKYIDPSYIVRSVPANCEDAILCDQFGRRAAHAAMAGKTGMLVGHVNSKFVNVPIAMAVSQKRCMAVEGELWGNVLAATGQPRRLSMTTSTAIVTGRTAS